MGIVLFTHLMEFQGNLWSYCTDRWLKFMDNPGKHTVTQREVLPWWCVVQAGFKGAQGAHPLIRGAAFRKDRQRIFQQAQGLLSSLAALHFEDVGKPDFEPVEFNDLLMASFESVYRGRTGEPQTFKERVLKSAGVTNAWKRRAKRSGKNVLNSVCQPATAKGGKRDGRAKTRQGQAQRTAADPRHQME